MPLWPGGESPSFPGAKTIGGALTVLGTISLTGRIAVGDNMFWGSSVVGTATGAYAAMGNAGRGLDLGLNRAISFYDGTLLNSNPDASIGRAAAGSIAIGGIGNGQLLGVMQRTELTTIAAAATTDTTILMPANAGIVGVSVLVTVVIPTATTFSVGDSGSATRFSTANVNVAAMSSDPGTKAGWYYNASATAVRLTMNGGTPAANSGRVRVTIHYFDVTPATS